MTLVHHERRRFKDSQCFSTNRRQHVWYFHIHIFFFFFFYSIMVYASGGVQHMTQRFCLEFHRLLSSNWQNRREAFIVKESQECVYRHGCSADRIIALTRSFISSNRDEESLVALKGTWIVQFHFILFFININFFLDSCSWN